MNFLLWLSQKMDALVDNKRQIALAALGLAALAALVFLVPLLLEDNSRLAQVQAPANVVTKPLGPPAPVAISAPEPTPAPALAPEKEPVKEAAAVVPPAPAPIPAPAPALAPAPAPAAAPTVAATYQVQLGAFREEARAKRLARRVQRAGFPTTIMPVDTPAAGRLHRVRLKPELPHDEARQLLAKLHKKMPKLEAILVRSGG
jgi:cell division septation protein DedD